MHRKLFTGKGYTSTPLHTICYRTNIYYRLIHARSGNDFRNCVLCESLRSSFHEGELSNLRRLDTVDVTAAPICVAGPSFPADLPNAIVMIVATSLTGTTAALILPECFMNRLNDLFRPVTLRIRNEIFHDQSAQEQRGWEHKKIVAIPACRGNPEAEQLQKNSRRKTP